MTNKFDSLIGENDYFEDDVSAARQVQTYDESAPKHADILFIVEGPLNDTTGYECPVNKFLAPNGKKYTYLILGARYKNPYADTLYVHFTDNEDVIQHWMDVESEQESEDEWN